MRRLLFILLAILSSLAAGGCMRSAETIEFANGAVFTARPGDDFAAVTWGTPRGNNPVPVVIVHLPDGDVNNVTLADAKALQQRGWAMDDRGGGFVILSTTQNRLYVASSFDQGKWTGSSVSAWNVEGPAVNVVSINGTKLSFPITEANLIALFGNPVARHPPR